MAADADGKPATDDITALYDRLDDLWAKYLRFLDEYTTAQAVIKKYLAAGHFSLTQANFRSSGRRYGQDFYDDRAVASTRVEVGGAAELKIFKVEDGVRREEEHEAGGARDLGQSVADRVSQLPSPSPTPEPEGEKAAEAVDAPAGHDEEESRKSAVETAAARDPLRWFGILVPPPLRQAQASFSCAMVHESGVGKAVVAARGMRDAEFEIRQVRKTIRRAERGRNL